ncbi:hypothetical protein V8E53_000260 [Lactarius tabidus]
MVDFQNPAVIEKDFLAVVKLWHLVDGIFLWEFFITLDYEWSIIRGHRPYRWTIWIYSLARVCTLIAVILNMLAFDSSTPINCQVGIIFPVPPTLGLTKNDSAKLWVIFELISASLAFAAASILIVLRMCVYFLSSNGADLPQSVLICDGGFVESPSGMGTELPWQLRYALGTPTLRSLSTLHAAWVPTQSVCVVLNTESTRKNVTATLVTDVVLLLTMLVGLLRMRLHGNSMFGLAEILWRQGLIWLFLATVAEVTPAVFIGLNLNGKINVIASLAIENNELELVGGTRSFQSHVSNSRTYRDVNRCDADLSVRYGAHSERTSQTNLLSARCGQPGGGGRAHVLRGLSADDDGPTPGAIGGDEESAVTPFSEALRLLGGLAAALTEAVTADFSSLGQLAADLLSS